MKHYGPSILCLSLLLCACGQKPVSDEGETMLKNIHARMKEKMMTHALTIESPLIAKATSSSKLKIFPSASYAGTADIALKTEMVSDASDEKSPVGDLSLTLTAAIETSGNVRGAPTDRLDAHVVMNARVIDRTIAVRMAKAYVNAPSLIPQPFSLPAAMSSQWYGETFEGIDAYLKAHSPTKEPPIAETINSALRGIHATPEALETFLDKAHVWNAEEILPEENGLARIRVVSDKTKVRDTVRALLAYIQTISGPSFESRMRAGGDLKTMMDSLKKNDAEFMKTMGTIKGILSVEKETYDIRGFSGEMYNETGARTATIEIAIAENGDITLSMIDLQAQEEIVFMKVGTTVKLMAHGMPVMTGAISEKRVELSFQDPKTGAKVGTIAFDIVSFSSDLIEISQGILTIPAEKIVLNITSLRIALTNTRKNIEVKAAASCTREGSPFFTFTTEGSRVEVPPFSFEKPNFKPFKAMQEDFMTVLMPPDPVLDPLKAATEG